MTIKPMTRRHALGAGAALAGVTTLAACGGGGDDADVENPIQDQIDSPDDNVITDTAETKIVEEKTSVTFITGRPPNTEDDWSNVYAAKEAEELTNIEVDYGLIPMDGIEEKRNLALASGDYAEAFYRTNLGTGDIAKYGSQGVFVPLNDLIDQYMPNLTAIIDEDPQIREAITFPDGNIYSLPTIYERESLALRYGVKLWVRQDWLDDFGMEVPETLEQYTAYLKEAVETKEGAVGLTDDLELGSVISCLRGTFGIGNRGARVANFDVDPDSGALRFFPTSDGYREMLEYLHDLYSQGLIMEDVFSADPGNLRTLGTEGRLSSTAEMTPVGAYGEEGENYIPLKPLKKTSSDDVPEWTAVSGGVAGIGQFAMTDACEHPIEIARWMDFWYSEQGARMFFLGEEGVSYEEVDGELVVDPDIDQADQGFKPYALFMGGSYPGYVSDKWFNGWETLPQALEAAEMLDEYSIEEVWEPFTFTADESDILSTMGTDVDKHLEESRSAFITGTTSLDDWDTYVSQFESMGIEEYIEIHQAAHDRKG